MAYRYLEHLTRADVAFEATAPSLEGLFRSAAEATLQTMVSDLSTIREKESRDLNLRSESSDLDQAVDGLLHDFLEKLVFYKDADQLLLKPRRLELLRGDQGYELRAELWGEPIDPLRHELVADVKAVTMHQFRVEKTPQGWQACVVLDV